MDPFLLLLVLLAQRVACTFRNHFCIHKQNGERETIFQMGQFCSLESRYQVKKLKTVSSHSKLLCSRFNNSELLLFESSIKSNWIADMAEQNKNVHKTIQS